MKENIYLALDMHCKWKSQGIAMENSTVCTYLMETPTDQAMELSNYQKSLAQVGIDIEVGKVVTSTR